MASEYYTARHSPVILKQPRFYYILRGARVFSSLSLLLVHDLVQRGRVPAVAMNCPSRVDPVFTEGWNQNPDALNADATTRADLNHMANARLQQDHRIDPADALTVKAEPDERNVTEGLETTAKSMMADSKGSAALRQQKSSCVIDSSPSQGSGGNTGCLTHDWRSPIRVLYRGISSVFRKYAKAIGPGFMVAVAYIDPGRNLPCVSSLRFLWAQDPR